MENSRKKGLMILFQHHPPTEWFWGLSIVSGNIQSLRKSTKTPFWQKWNFDGMETKRFLMKVEILNWELWCFQPFHKFGVWLQVQALLRGFATAMAVKHRKFQMGESVARVLEKQRFLRGCWGGCLRWNRCDTEVQMAEALAADKDMQTELQKPSQDDLYRYLLWQDLTQYKFTPQLWCVIDVHVSNVRWIRFCRACFSAVMASRGFTGSVHCKM